MIIKDTIPTKSVELAIARMVGERFPFMDRLRNGGPGSQRFLVQSASDEIRALLEGDALPDYCNLELRQRGIIVRFKSRAETYAWTIPFHFLNLFINGVRVSIYGPQHHVKVVPAYQEPLKKKYLTRIMTLLHENSHHNFPP